MKIFGQFVYGAISLVVVCALSLPVVAQKGGKSVPPAPKPAASPQNIPSPQNNTGNAGRNNRNQPNGKPENLRQMAKLPPRFVEKLEDMSPEQRERFLQNNERFRNMNPEQQARIRQHLQDWNSMTPQQRIQYREQQQAWESMSPAEQKYVRQEMLPQLSAMAPAQRQFLRQHVRELEGLGDAERDAKMHDPNFVQGLGPEEQRMVLYLSRLHWAGVVEAPTPPGN